MRKKIEHASILVAQTLCLPGQPTCLQGPLPTDPITKKTFFTTPGSIINAALSVLFPVAGLILFINLVIGGFQYLTSQGDEKAMTSARGRITSSLLGYGILLAAFWIAQLISRILKLPGPFS